MNYGSDYKFIPATSIESGHGIEVLRDLFLLHDSNRQYMLCWKS